MIALVDLRMLKKVTIVGSGSWATALVKIFSESGTRVSWFVRNQAQADFICRNGHNPRYLSFALLKMERIEPVIDPLMAINGSDLIVFAVPSAYLKDTLQHFDKELLVGKSIAVSIKGFVPGSGCTPSHYIRNYTGDNTSPMMVLSGPCHAEEIANRRNTYLTVSSADHVWTDVICKVINSDYIHAVPNNDPVGIEYASILKNIIAIGCGIANGLHYGDNFQAVLVSNAMREAGQFIESVDTGKRDLFQSAYFGDLLVTAYSDYSRNRTLGKLVGRGIHVNKALQAMEMIAEGFPASKELAPLLKKSKISLPIINTVHRVLHQHANPFHEFKLLEEQLS